MIGAIPRGQEGPAIRNQDLHTVLFGRPRLSKWRQIPMKYRIAGLALIAALIVSAVLTYGPRGKTGASGWETLYRKTGLYGESSKLYNLPLCVTFIDVGQGDCILVRSGSSYLLIDSGNPGNERVIRQELKKQGCRELDYVISTHPHADHIGSFPELLSEFPVKTIILPEADPKYLDDPALYERVLTSFRRSGGQIILAQPGKQYSLGTAKFQVLGPVRRSENVNNLSVAVRLNYRDVSFLFTGDAEAEEEYDIMRTGLPIRSTVLKCGHHGSKTSTAPAFLRAVSPEAAIISCGKNNDYGHPSPVTLEKLETAGISIFRTDQQGTIVVGTDGKKIWYS